MYSVFAVVLLNILNITTVLRYSLALSLSPPPPLSSSLSLLIFSLSLSLSHYFSHNSLSISFCLNISLVLKIFFGVRLIGYFALLRRKRSTFVFLFYVLPTFANNFFFTNSKKTKNLSMVMVSINSD